MPARNKRFEHFVSINVVNDIEVMKAVLLETNDNFRNIFYNSADAIAITSNRAVYVVNDSMIKLFNAKNEKELLTLSPADVSPEFQPCGRPSFEMITEYFEKVSEKEFLRFEWTYKKMTGELFTVEVSIIQIKNRGKVFVYAVHRDLALQKKIEKKLHQAVKIANANSKAKSMFLATVSHEIRTPMSAILGFSEMLRMELKDAKLLQFVNYISTSGNSMMELIDDLLDITKIETGKFDFKYRPIFSRIFFTAFESFFQFSVGDKKIKFKVKVEPSLPEVLILAELRVKQVIVNLVSNAIKFTNEGFVKLNVSHEKKENVNALDLIIKIADSGIGIPNNQQENIFEAFEQVANQDPNKYGGTGLGLTITRELMTAMNGHISLSSKVGQGSVFTLYFFDVEIEQKKKVK